MSGGGGGGGGGGAAPAASAAAQLWRTGQRAMRSGDLGTALGAFQAAQAADPSHAGVWLSTAVALGAVGQPDKACVCLALAVDAARAAEAEAAGAGGPLPAWPSTVAAVASSNLYSLARKHALCTAELPERLCDAAFAAHAAAAVAREAPLAVAACGGNDGGGGGGVRSRLLRVVLEGPSGAEASAVGRAAAGAVAGSGGGWRVEVVSRHPSEFMSFVDGNVEKEGRSGAVYRAVVAGEEDESEEEEEAADAATGAADVVLRVAGACGFPLLMQAGLWGGAAPGAAAAAAAAAPERRCGRCELWGRLVSSRDLRLLETVDTRSVERATGLCGLGAASAGLRGCVRPVDAAQWRAEAASAPTRLLADLPDGFLEAAAAGSVRTLPQLSLASDVAFGGGGELTGVLVWEEHVVDGAEEDDGAGSRYSLRAGCGAGGSQDAPPPHSRWQYMLYAGEEAAPSLHKHGVAAGGSVAFTLAVQGASREISVAFAEEGGREEEEEEGCSGGCPAASPPSLRLPPYHAVMLNDEQRTLAYLKGLQEVRRRFEPRDAAAAASSAPPPPPPQPPAVVDLGAGTGLLSLLAAKAAGFERVYAVERFEEMARITRRVIEANDAAASITLLAKHSSDLSAEDFGGRRGEALPAAAVLVHEIFGTDPLSEGLIPAYNAAVKQGLVDASTAFCPSRFRVHAAVGSSATLMAKAGRGAGGGRAGGWGPVPCVVPRKLEEDLAKVSDVVYATEPRVVWEVQLDGRPLPLTGAKEVALRRAAAVAAAPADLVFYWFDFLCGDSQWYSTAPQPGAATPVAHWVQNIEVLDRPVFPDEGTEVYRLVLAWNADRVMFVHPRRKPEGGDAGNRAEVKR